MYFCRSIHERQEFGYTKTLLRKQRTSVIFYSMDKNERIYNEQEMPAETKKNHSADADRVKEVYKVTIAGSIINVVLLVLKFAAGILGHSAAMIADAIHSLTDFATDVVVLVFVKLGNKPKDKDHDYGHGKYETLATAIIGISLFVVGVMICYSGVTKTYRAICGETLQQPGVVALIARAVFDKLVSDVRLRFADVRACEVLIGFAVLKFHMLLLFLNYAKIIAIFAAFYSDF